MAGPAPTVAIVGMAALRRDLTRMGADNGPLNKALAAAGKRAVEPVAAITRSELPQDTGRLAGDVRTTGSRSGAAVRMGRASIRYAGWVEFGGHRHVPHESERAYDPRGRFLFPAALRLQSSVAAEYARAAQQAVDAFTWSNETTNPESVHD